MRPHEPRARPERGCHDALARRTRAGLARASYGRATAEEALVLARRIAANEPRAVAVSEQVVRRFAPLPIEEAYARRQPVVEPVLTSENAREGARAFAERPPPARRDRCPGPAPAPGSGALPKGASGPPAG